MASPGANLFIISAGLASLNAIPRPDLHGQSNADLLNLNAIQFSLNAVFWLGLCGLSKRGPVESKRGHGQSMRGPSAWPLWPV